MIIRRKHEMHGEGGKRNHTPEYRAWEAMRQRCNNPKNSDYRNYGGRGICVCRAWESSYVTFLSDMGRKPTTKHSLDRIDPNLGYSVENCRWATQKTQGENRRPVLALKEINRLREMVISLGGNPDVTKT